MPRTLYHYTSSFHFPSIYENGFLKTVESNISMTQEHVGPDVVWLTDEPDLEDAGWNHGSILNKTEIRITVEVDDAIRWETFAFAHKIEPAWYDILNTAGGGAAEHWYVVPRPIRDDEFTEVRMSEEAAANLGLVEA